jgi:hypothetical protein
MQDDRTPTFTRRAVAAAGIGSLLLPAGAMAAPAPGRGATPDIGTTYAKLRGSLKEDLTSFWYQGQIFLAPDDDTPVAALGVIGFSYSRFIRQADGAWDTKLIEVGYYTDPEVQRIVDEIPNPLNGKPMKPSHFLSPLQRAVVRGDGSVEPGMPVKPPGRFSGRVWAPVVQGDEVWISEDLLARLPAGFLPDLQEGSPSASGFVTLGSMATYRARRRDVENPGLVSVPCTFHLQTLGSFQPWMQMGTVPGRQMWRVHGAKIGSAAEMPPMLRARIERDHPKFIAAPGI